MSKPAIWFVHGAGATERSFAYLAEKFHGRFDVHLPQYHVDDGVTTVVERLRGQIETNSAPAVVVGHSLGGLIAAGLTACPLVERIVTMASPFGGMSYAGLLSFWWDQPLFRDLCMHGRALMEIRSAHAQAAKPHLAIVATRGGLPSLTGEASDGVVTEASQTAITGARFLRLPVNHFEVLLSDEAKDAIWDFVV